MPNQPPASVPPSGVPGGSGGGSGPYVAVAVVLVVVMGGLLCWKYKQSGQTPPPVASVQPPPSETVARPHLDAPPPPPDEPTPVPETSVSGKKPTVGGGAGLCASPCTGTATGGMKTDISTRAGNARGCYERALRANPNIQGKMTLNVRVDSLGGICSASISNDSVGSGEVQACVLGMFRGQRVTAPTGGCVDVSVPLNFQPKNK